MCVYHSVRSHFKGLYQQVIFLTVGGICCCAYLVLFYCDPVFACILGVPVHHSCQLKGPGVFFDVWEVYTLFKLGKAESICLFWVVCGATGILRSWCAGR